MNKGQAADTVTSEKEMYIPAKSELGESSSFAQSLLGHIMVEKAFEVLFKQ